MTIRETNWARAQNTSFDVAVIGAGINGASVYERLCSDGYSVLLVDKGDFGCGSSQDSAMMIWGGLLYLKNLDLASVIQFSHDRDQLIRTRGAEILPQWFRYIPAGTAGRNKLVVYLALLLYRLLGMCRREKPGFQNDFEELAFLKRRKSSGSLRYQEGFLRTSDARFVLNWIISHQSSGSAAMNYCEITAGEYDRHERQWRLALSDRFSDRACTVQARLVVNCAGVWADRVNERFGIRTPYRHALSKGVFIGFPRPDAHRLPLIFEMGQHGDILTFIPWGPVSLWGPTETMAETIEEGYSIASQDIDFLLEHASRHLGPSVTRSRPVSLRCGLRPLAVKKDFAGARYPLDISRHHRIVPDPSRQWISVYGGKISGCLSLAGDAASKVKRMLGPGRRIMLGSARPEIPEAALTVFPGIDRKVPSVDWCVQHEFCCTLEDYLRRRTNISQWVPREGLGFRNEHRRVIEDIAKQLPQREKPGAAVVGEYARRVEQGFDRLLGNANLQGGLP